MRLCVSAYAMGHAVPVQPMDGIAGGPDRFVGLSIVSPNNII